MGVNCRRRLGFIVNERAPAVSLALTVVLLAALLCAADAIAGTETQPLADILQSLSRHGAQLIYSNETVPRELKAAPPPADLPLEEQLRQLLTPVGLEARRLTNGAFVIARVEPTKGQLAVTTFLERDGALEPLSGALVILGNSKRRGVSDAAGRVEFDDLPFGRLEVEARYNGLTAVARSVQLSAATANAELALRFAAPASLEEIRIQGTIEDAGASISRVATRDVLESTPISSDDASRSLQLLPGAAAAGYTAKTHIRGSRDDETLFRYDGVSLLDPYHFETLQSLTSAIDPSVIESTTAWTGVAPIQYAQAVGAVVDIAPRSVTAPVADLRLSNRDLNVVAGVPLASDQGSLLAAVHMFNDISPVQWLDSASPAPSHRDYLLRSTWSLGSDARLAAGFLAIDDTRKVLYNDKAPERAEPENRERYAWLRGWLTISPQLRSETLLSAERSQGQIDGRVNEPAVESGFLFSKDRHSAFTLREELNFRPTDRWSALAGLERTQTLVDEVLIANATYLPPFVPGLQPVPQLAIDSSAEIRAVALSLYGAIRWQRGEDTVLDLGARHNQRQFAQSLRDQHWNGSAALKQKLSDSSSINLGWNQVTQEDVLEVRYDPNSGFGPSDARVVRQVNLGAEHAIGNWLFLKADLYDKRERSSRESSEDVLSRYTLIPEIALDNQSVYSTGGRMRGIELQAETDRLQPLSGWISYTHSSAEDRIQGQWFPRSWDQPDAVQIGGRWATYPWKVTGLFSWHTGWPTTPLLASSTVWQDPNAAQVTYGARNSERLPSYASLDLRVSWDHPLSVGIFQVSLELNDVTNAKSVCCRYLSVRPTSNGSELIVASDYWVGFAPQLTFRWRL
jgi:hypothetical protein